MEITRITSENHEEYDELMKTLIPEIYNEDNLEELECFSIADDNEVGGVIAASIKNEMPFIECIYVMPHLRLMGYGSQLLNAVELLMETYGYESIGALDFVDTKTGTNLFGFESKYVDDFLNKQGYFITKLGNTEEIDLNDVDVEEVEIKYATKVF